MTVNVSKPAVNVREKLAELDKPTGIAGEAMLRAETPQEQFNLIGAGRRNLIINGDFQVSQRGDYSSATNITSNVFWLDRWKFEGTISRTVQRLGRSKLPNGDTAYSAKTITTASGTGYIGQRYVIEDFAILSEKNVVWSFWYKTNNKDFVLRHSGTTNLDFTAVADEQWHYATVPYFFPEATTNNSSAGGTGFYFATLSSNGGNVALATGDYFEIAQVQLEVGKVATPFEHRSYGEELTLCQRYYQVIANVSSDTLGTTHKWSSTDYFTFLQLPVEMRTQPTLDTNVGSLSNSLSWKSMGYTSNHNSISLDGDSSPRQVRLNHTVTNNNISLGASGWTRMNSGSAYVNLSAEL